MSTLESIYQWKKAKSPAWYSPPFMISLFHWTLVLVNNPTTKHGIVAYGLIQQTGYNQYCRLIKLNSLLTDQEYVKQTVKVIVAHEFNFNKPCQKKKM